MRLKIIVLYLSIFLTAINCFGGGEIVPQAVTMNACPSNVPKAYGISSNHMPIKAYNKECPICLDSEEKIKQTGKVYLDCKHIMCKKCYDSLKINKCPLCRKLIEQVSVVSEQQIPQQAIVESDNKEDENSVSMQERSMVQNKEKCVCTILGCAVVSMVCGLGTLSTGAALKVCGCGDLADKLLVPGFCCVWTPLFTAAVCDACDRNQNSFDRPPQPYWADKKLCMCQQHKPWITCCPSNEQ